MATVTYYWNGYDGSSSGWTSPGNAVDGDTGTFASTSGDYNSSYLSLDTNTCSGTDLGTIDSARARAYGYAQSGTDMVDSWSNLWGLPASAGWGDWLDWALIWPYDSPTWALVASLVVGEFSSNADGKTIYLARIEIEVTYSPSGGAASVVPVIAAQYRQRRA